MDCSYTLPCPNCGASAVRRYFRKNKIQETHCDSCDYLLVSCETTGRVLESYAPGLYAANVKVNIEPILL